ncbi:phosphoadenosine phosphosulfate reductase family protein [Pantoea ananatis]|uniref:phosphoadenosine phosphosulfate reductase domain-containing protein n=1 Tax=Pantoea ananas TaxID=553 RepID=UPI000D718010|nr:phosphoadenosine phosphosulfate reductase family protein [Pantoea ananatis]PWV88035.1 3'-phosphoadenosine 5'-phosphosulfate sulfotransferase (PAPS reductase)/FAD synthetase [Pantoea ananatis]REC90881.1 3'-phosphoadenosine 5'-phosphosulfate sulfotransferase (PAPS reductase)/FAD synthetase [Pantoea ananatis]
MIDARCFAPGVINLVTVSGGKDSLADWLLAIESGVEFQAAHADTGHEHPQTVEYLAYLESKLGPIRRVKADFTQRIADKKNFVRAKWPASLVHELGFSEAEAIVIVGRALKALKPTGIPFLDLCIWKGTFPSTRRKFCSFELKQIPMQEQVVDKLIAEGKRVITWQGVRAQESQERAALAEWEEGFDIGPNLSIYRPILKWTHDEVFALAKRHGIKPNPLYQQGCSRVGCMPCVNVNKAELGEIFMRWPEEISRVAEWERIVAQCSRRGNAAFFHSGMDPMKAETDGSNVTLESHGIEAYRDWALTTRGGRQFDMLGVMNDKAVCSSVYLGVCE